MKKHYLYPGMVYASKEETEVATLLGSCVSIVLIDPIKKIGGMNHYLLPPYDSSIAQTARYGDVAIQQLLEAMKKEGADTGNLKAKVYGGGNVVSNLTQGDSIGQRNIEFALSTLEKLRIPVLEKNIGGDQGRRIQLNTLTGAVTHKFNDSSESTTDGPVLDLSGRPKYNFKKDVKVLIVDDSAAIRSLFTKAFEKAGLKVVGAASDPFEARELLIKHSPDVMTLDIEMPKMNGVQFLEKIMKHLPIPTVMVSSLSADGAAALKCLDLGAIEFFHKTSQHDPTAIREMGEILVEKVRAAATVNLKAKIAEISKASAANPVNKNTPQPEAVKGKRPKALKLILVGGNAGSAESLETFVSKLHQDTPPVVIACSTIGTFLPSFIAKLSKKTQLNLKVGENNMILGLGTVVFIPAGFHGKIIRSGLGFNLRLEKSPPVNSQIPSSTVLFSSAAEQAAQETVGVLLGGYGTDGVAGLTQLQDKGGTTIVQFPEETNFPFLPQSAISAGVADNILKVDSMAQFLFEFRSKAVI